MQMQKFLSHTLLALLFAAIFLLPDFIFKVFHNEYFLPGIKIYKEFAGFFILNFILLMVPNFNVKYFFYVIFMFFILTEQLHYSFFHSLIMPYEVPMLFEQPDEVFDSLFGVGGYVVLPLVLFFSMLVLIYYFLKKSSSLTVMVRVVPITLLVLILSTGSVVASQRNSPYVFYPKAESSAIKNVYNALSWNIGKGTLEIVGNHEKSKTFKSYQIKDVSIVSPKTIIVVMGESLGAKYMSFYGFNKETTPLLDKRKNELLSTWGYSAGIETRVSVPTFFMVKREPQNNMVLLKNNTNLFTLAKASGYTTHYITTQKLTILGSYLGNNVDHVMSAKDFDTDGVVHDEVLVNYLKKVDFSQKNFIVLHQRNSHSPYADQTPKEFYKFPFKGKEYKEHMQNSYFNSILYTDSLYDEIIQISKVQDESAMVFFTSDHSEMLGNEDEDGRFGHAHLGFSDAKVPMMIYLNDKAAFLKPLFSLENIISHYQFSKLIVKSLGKEIINPNENGEFYTNGVDISGSEGFLPFKKKSTL